jgi:hypothetical protein
LQVLIEHEIDALAPGPHAPSLGPAQVGVDFAPEGLLEGQHLAGILLWIGRLRAS